jgi:hypothetical protein
LEIVPYEHLIRAIARHLNRRWGGKGELPELFMIGEPRVVS